jgi:hypothetical protein
MSVLRSFARSAYYFFVEDGSIVIGAIVTLVLVGVLAVWQPFPGADRLAGPLLFLLISGLLIASLLRVVHQSRSRA